MAKTASKPPFPTRVDLSVETRSAMGVLLNHRLADFLDLERQAKHAHWNVKGIHFEQLHELFDQVAALAVTWSDDLAERAVQLGCVAEGSVQTVAERSQLPECPVNVETPTEWVQVVADALAACANAAREDINAADDADDAITADLLTRITGEADKQLWFVEAHLEKQS